jgi:hypothetical protein
MAPIAEGKFFISLDGGPRFRVTHVRLEGDDSITLSVVLDVSQPFPTLMAKMDVALAGLAPLSLKAKDHVTVYSMDCSLIRSTAVDVPANSLVLKTAVDAVLQPWRTNGRARWKHGCKGEANLWDSLTLVTQALSRLPGRRVILAVTDGVDRGSKTSWTTLRALAQADGVAIFGLMPSGELMVGMGSSSHENLFNSLCELSGGMVLTASSDLGVDLRRFTELLRGRYIVEFPHPVDTVGGNHQMDITVDKMEAFIRPTGIAVPVDDPSILGDPATIQADPAHAPQLGKRKVLGPQ